MQETTHVDGTVVREFFGEEEESNKRTKMMDAYEKACDNKDVSEIKQVKNCMRNRPCPCGSGKKFKKCCISLVNKGPRFVKEDSHG